MNLSIHTVKSVTIYENKSKIEFQYLGFTEKPVFFSFFFLFVLFFRYVSFPWKTITNCASLLLPIIFSSQQGSFIHHLLSALLSNQAIRHVTLHYSVSILPSLYPVSVKFFEPSFLLVIEMSAASF